MKHLLSIIAAIATHLAGKQQALTAKQIFTNSSGSGLAYSEPFYPSPWMSGKGDWADAYAQARDFVSQLTLLEKVNLTTGVGWEGEQCVGQVRLSNVTYMRFTNMKKVGSIPRLGLRSLWYVTLSHATHSSTRKILTCEKHARFTRGHSFRRLCQCLLFGPDSCCNL